MPFDLMLSMLPLSYTVFGAFRYLYLLSTFSLTYYVCFVAALHCHILPVEKCVNVLFPGLENVFWNFIFALRKYTRFKNIFIT